MREIIDRMTMRQPTELFENRLGIEVTYWDLTAALADRYRINHELGRNTPQIFGTLEGANHGCPNEQV